VEIEPESGITRRLQTVGDRLAASPTPGMDVGGQVEPAVVPEVLLAFKAMELRPRDEADFEACCPR
jgi:hypothetical protein